MRTAVGIRLLLLSVILLAFSHGAFAQIGIGISVNFGPPALPVYEQPICPTDGYLWTPGYWAFYEGGYFWVPGTWVQPPQVGFLWTPGYWGWGGNAFVFNEGYWGPQVGYYGGINYGFGYGGLGYEGGRWEGGHFAYNTYVNRADTTVIHNTYNTTVVNVSENHVSYNGGSGGVEARPTPQQESYAKESHVGPVAEQTQHVQAARSNPELRASANMGKPPIAATAKPADFKTGVVSTKQAGGEYKAPAADAARGNVASPPKEASELQEHKFTPPNTATPQQTRNTNSNRPRWLPSKRRTTRNSSSNRKRNTSKQRRRITTTRKSSRWRRSTRSRRNSSSKSTLLSSSWNSTRRRQRPHQSSRSRTNRALVAPGRLGSPGVCKIKQRTQADSGRGFLVSAAKFKQKDFARRRERWNLGGNSDDACSSA